MDPQNNASTSADTSTKMSDIDTKKQDSTNTVGPTDPADPAFFKLSLEERNKIYHQLLDPRGRKTLSIEPPNSLKAINKLLDVSPEVRSEVVALIASETKARIQAGIWHDLKLEPYTVAVANERSRKKKKKTSTNQIPSDLKVWNMIILAITAESQLKIHAKLDFKEKTVRIVSLPDFDEIGLAGGYCDTIYAWFEGAFLKALKAFTDKDGFDGFLLKDVPELLHKVDMPCPKHFWDYDHLFGEREYDEWDEYDEYDDYDDYDDYDNYNGEGESYDDFGDEEDCSDEDGEDDGDSEHGDFQCGAIQGGVKVEGGELKVKVEDIKVDEKTKGEATNAGN